LKPQAALPDPSNRRPRGVTHGAALSALGGWGTGAPDVVGRVERAAEGDSVPDRKPPGARA
jgi:hypothetical protein